jgi:hypothetical protein
MIRAILIPDPALNPYLAPTPLPNLNLNPTLYLTRCLVRLAEGPTGEQEKD